MTTKGTYRGKRLEDMTKAELIDAICELHTFWEQYRKAEENLLKLYGVKQ